MNLFSFISSQKNTLTPLIRQHEYTECGLACLAMVLGHYGHHTSVSQLRREYTVSEDAGTSMADLLQWSNSKGLEGRILKGNIKEVKNVSFPLIAFWRGNHFVVIVKSDVRGITIHDPACGIRTYKYSEAESLFSGYVLELKPTQEFKNQDKQKDFKLEYMARFISQVAKKQLVLFLFSLFSLIILLISPSYVQLVLDEAIARNDFDLAILLTFIFAIVFIFDVASKFIKQILEICMRNFAYDDLSQHIRGFLLRTHPSYFRTRPVGVILAIEKSLHACADFISNGYVLIVYSAMIAIFSMIFMLFYNIYIAMITLASMAIFLAIRFILIGPYQRAVDNSITKTAEYESLLVETQKGIITVKANNMEVNLNSIIDRSMREHINGLMKRERLLARFDAASVGVINIEQLIVVCFGAWSILKGEMTIGMLFAYLSYKRYFADSVIQLAHKYLDKNALQGPLERIGDLVTYQREDDQFGERVMTHVDEIEFNDVNFAYPAKSVTLKNISLTLHYGEETVIIGRSGSGKTTFLRLVSGILAASSGDIRINQHPLTSYKLTSLREHIRIVHADDTLFTGSVAENIGCFDSELDLERIIWACKLAEIHHIISELAHGYDTPFVPGSPFFSAGEVQRLVLARALYSRPDWLLCDEVTANLDKETAQKVLQNLRSLSIGLVFVTHSPEVVYQGGQLLKLDCGNLTKLENGLDDERNLQ